VKLEFDIDCVDTMKSDCTLTVITVYKNNLRDLLATGMSLMMLEANWIIVSGSGNDEELLRGNILREFEYLPGPDRGIYHGMNRGIELAPKSSKMFWFLNAGDVNIYQGNRFQDQIMKSNSVILFRMYNQETEKLNSSVFARFLLKSGIRPISHQAVFFPSQFVFANRYLEDIGNIADQEYILRALEKFPLKTKKLVISYFQGHGAGSMNSSPALFHEQIRLVSGGESNLAYKLSQAVRIVFRRRRLSRH